MKTAWSGLLLGLSALPAAAMNCESPSLQGELEGKFDASGEVCFDLPRLGENYVAATLSGVTDARLLDEHNRRLRTLLAGGPAPAAAEEGTGGGRLNGDFLAGARTGGNPNGGIGGRQP